jgi:hypothetical protein
MYIHQIFLSIEGSSMSDYPSYVENAAATKALNPEYAYVLWTDDSADAFLRYEYPELIPFVQRFPHRFYLIDFLKYLLLARLGGIYVDLDEWPLRALPPPSELAPIVIGNCQFLGNVKIQDDERFPPNNNICRLPPDVCDALIDYAQKEFNRVSAIKAYATRPARALKHSVSVCMFARFCKARALTSSIPPHTYFFNQNSRAWECMVASRRNHFRRSLMSSYEEGLTDSRPAVPPEAATPDPGDPEEETDAVSCRAPIFSP